MSSPFVYDPLQEMLLSQLDRQMALSQLLQSQLLQSQQQYRPHPPPPVQPRKPAAIDIGPAELVRPKELAE